MMLWYVVAITATAAGSIALLINESIQHKRTIERSIRLQLERRELEHQLRSSIIERNRISRRNAELERKLSSQFPTLDPPILRRLRAVVRQAYGYAGHSTRA